MLLLCYKAHTQACELSVLAIMRHVRCGDNPALYLYSAASANASGISMGVLFPGGQSLMCDSRGTLSGSNIGRSEWTRTLVCIIVYIIIV